MDNPEFVYRLCYDVDENVLHKIISINERSLNFRFMFKIWVFPE